MSTADCLPSSEQDASPDMDPVLIGVDWGTSSFRAYLMNREGAVLEKVESADGVSAVPPGAFPAAYRRLVGPWLAARPGIAAIASGMVGSRNGWREAPYARCPANPATIADALVAVDADGARVWLAPGLACEDESGAPDVMRGEEVEILGIADAGARLVVLPGSHSKWAEVEGGRVLRFRTFVTGELFAAVKDHTLLGAFARAAPPQEPGPAFALGVETGAAAARGEKGAGFIGALFSARTLPLMGKLAEKDAREYLSGLMIGAEIAEASRLFSQAAPSVAGAPALVRRYLAAFAALDLRSEAAPAGAAARGLFLLSWSAGLFA